MDIYEIKRRIAEENARSLQALGIDLKGKRVLDIGFGLGYNASIMTELGAEVYGVEPDRETFDYAVQKGLIDEERAFNTTLQDMPEELFGTFDLSAIFLYNIPFLERENFMKALSRSIKPIGTTVIGLHDEIFMRGDRYLEPVSTSLRRYFNSVVCKTANANIGNRMFIKGEEPRTIKKDIDISDGWDR